MKPLRIVSSCVLGLALALAGCQSDSPTEPGGGSSTPATPKPPTPAVTYRITVSANPGQLNLGGTDPAFITVDVVRNDTGVAPPDGTEVTLTTSLGAFGSPGGTAEAKVQLVGGRAQAALYATVDSGTATIRATLDTSSGAANVLINPTATFFLSSVVPAVGDPKGGEEVTINGGGFDPPVRVTFNGGAAQVLSVQPNRIRVRSPSATAAGVVVPVGTPVPVSVSVTINLNETGSISDSLTNGYTYVQGGGIEQPQIFSVSPTTGVNEGGTTLRIRGSGFQTPLQVFFGFGSSAAGFNGVEARVTSVTPTEIVLVTPSARGFGQNLVDSLVDILVRNLNNGFTTVAGGSFRYGTEILITAMGPGSGPFTGGTRVTLHGQGFDSPVALSLGGVGQQVVSVTGTEIQFITSGVTVASCPATGFIPASGVSVTNIETGKTGSAPGLTFNYTVPKPLIFSVNPTSGSVGANLTITGSNFPNPLRVTFGGDTTTGASASITSSTSTTIVVKVPTPPPGFTFNTQPCDGNGDGNPGGTQNVATPISVTVTDLSGTGCATTLSNAFTLNPPNTTCTGDTTTPPTAACADGLDNDGDTLIDFPADPGCSSAADTTET